MGCQSLALTLLVHFYPPLEAAAAQEVQQVVDQSAGQWFDPPTCMSKYPWTTYLTKSSPEGIYYGVCEH